MEANETILCNDQSRAFKMFCGCVALELVGAYCVYSGFVENEGRWIIAAGLSSLIFLYPTLIYLWYSISKKPLMIFDEKGIRTPDGMKSVAWEEVTSVYYQNTRFFYYVVAVNHDGEEVLFKTGNVISLDKITEHLREYTGNKFMWSGEGRME